MIDLILLESVAKPEDCERRNALTGLDKPAIRFVPEKVTSGPTKMLEVELRLNPSAKSFDNTVKRKIPIFCRALWRLSCVGSRMSWMWQEMLVKPS